MANPPEIPIIETDQDRPLTISYVRREIRMITMSDSELESIASPGSSIHLTFFGISFGALVSFGTVLGTLTIPDPKTYAMFAGLTFVSAVLTLYFGIRGISDSLRARDNLKRLKNKL